MYEFRFMATASVGTADGAVCEVMILMRSWSDVVA